MARELPRRKHTSKFDVGAYVPAIDSISYHVLCDLAREVLRHLDVDDRPDPGINDPGDKVGEDFRIGQYVYPLDQTQTFEMVSDALQHLDEEEIFQLVLDELSPAGRARLLKRLEEEAWNAA
jgi:hypothetical protein